jgi:aconitate decarboxylase
VSRGSAVDLFADFVLDSSYDNLPPAVRQASKIFFLDSMAVGIAGSSVNSAQDVLHTAENWGDGVAATVLGGGKKMPATSAAFVNSFQTHCQEFDCLHEPATVHAMAVLCGALLASAEEQGYSGKDLILGVALGVDVAANIGFAATTGLRFFRPATAGVLGATAALARLEKFDRKQFKDAWGLAYSQLAGTMQAHVEGSVALPLQIAVAARAVLTSIQLVKQGLSGPHDILEGPFGYFELFEQGSDLEPVLGRLGQSWRVTELSHKPFPTGRAAQGSLEAIQILQAKAPLELDNITNINARVPPLVKRLVARPIKADMDISYARLCLQYLVPVLIKTGALDTSSYSAELLHDPEVLDAGRKVQVFDDGNPNPNALGPQKLEVVFKDGSRQEQAIPHTLGSPQNPLSREQYLEKFFHCMEVAQIPRAQADRLLALLEQLEKATDIEKIIELSCKPQP